MKITAITQQVKRVNRYSIYVDGKFEFGLSQGQLLDFGLVTGQELTSEKLTELKAESEFQKVFDHILNLLSIRPRSEHEIISYLQRKQQSPALIEKTLNKLSKLDYINDQDFARRWVDNRRLLKSRSSLKLRYELMQKGISDTIINEVLADNSGAEVTALEEMVQKKAKRYPDKQKFIQFLARQGFRYDDIKKALEQNGA